jgi:hypothetical protein
VARSTTRPDSQPSTHAQAVGLRTPDLSCLDALPYNARLIRDEYAPATTGGAREVLDGAWGAVSVREAADAPQDAWRIADERVFQARAADVHQAPRPARACCASSRTNSVHDQSANASAPTAPARTSGQITPEPPGGRRNRAALR